MKEDRSEAKYPGCLGPHLRYPRTLSLIPVLSLTGVRKGQELTEDSQQLDNYSRVNPVSNHAISWDPNNCSAMKKWEGNSPSGFDWLILANGTLQELVLCLGEILSQVYKKVFVCLDISPALLTLSLNGLQVPELVM